MFPRSLTPREADVVAALVAATEADDRVGDLLVASECGCGCPTVYFVHTPCEPGIEQVAIATIVGTLDVVVLRRSSCGELDSLEYMPVSGETPPGEFQAAVPSRQLHEDRLAAELGVSRNSVREPSRALVATDRIEGIPSQSAYVVAATGPTWFTRLRVRSVLEAHTAELAA